MGATKKMYVTMLEESYHEISMDLKQKFIKAEIIYDNDYELYRDNPTFQKLRKAKKKADHDLKEWKYNQKYNR